MRLASIKAAEWSALSVWVHARANELAMLAGILKDVPCRMSAFGVAALAQDCDRVDRKMLNGAALDGFEVLLAVVKQATLCAGAGLRFEPQAELAGQLDPQSLAIQSVGVLIGSPKFIAGKLP